MHCTRKQTAALLALWAIVSLLILINLMDQTGQIVQPPTSFAQDLHHFRISRNLQHYFDNIQLLVEPSTACEESTPLVIIVTSAPSNKERRQAIRETWGKHQPTYFLLGVNKHTDDEYMKDNSNHMEAKLYGDIVIYDLIDHYQNLTIKSALMLDWVSTRCRRADFLFKTDDDVVVNPWTMKKVLEEHPNDPLIGHMFNNSHLWRDEYYKWYLPRWLYPEESVPHYLSGGGYIIKVEYIPQILQQAKKVPLINIEDIYITYLVSNSINLSLTHDRRVSPFRPWIFSDCVYWTHASLHSFELDELSNVWRIIEGMANRPEGACSFFEKYLDNDYFLRQ